MTTTSSPDSSGPVAGPSLKRNFILQQGLCDPAAATCPKQFSALMFQPRMIGPYLLIALILQSPVMFFILGVVLWISALIPAVNPFDFVYNHLVASKDGPRLSPAPAPRRFSQGMAGTFGLAVGICLTMHWMMAAYVLEGMFAFAMLALVIGGFCLGSFIYHMVIGHGDFAKKTLPWAGEHT